jgi:tetratricopeptide (TPR) repeat protein
MPSLGRAGTNSLERGVNVPRDLMGIRVFLASPSGLETEREIFYKIIRAFNEDTGYADGVCFIPVGWELRTSAIGRPQGQINEDISQCDFFVLLLWDRWGSPTGDSKGAFRAGVEEEYELATRLLGDPSAAMRDISVLFKGVDGRQLSDPGHQLRMVLGFRERLEHEKSLLFTVFDSESELEREFRKLLYRWTREDLRLAKSSPVSFPQLTEDAAELSDDRDNHEPALQAAMRAARAGKSSQAERQFSRALIETDDPQASAEYAKFLRRSGRYAQARTVSERLLRQAEVESNFPLMVEALSSLGVIARKEGNFDEALGFFAKARSLISQLDLEDPRSVSRASYALDNYGHTLRRRGDLDAALQVFDQASRLRQSVDDRIGWAFSLNNMGIVQREQGSLDSALQSHLEALELFRELKRGEDIHVTESHLGSIEEDLGHYEKAKDLYRSALSGAREARNLDSVSINSGKLARLELENGHLSPAFQYASECLEVNERNGNEEGSAMGLLLLGQCYMSQRDWGRAHDVIEHAWERYDRIGHANGRIQSRLELAKADASMGDQSSANAGLLLVETWLEHKSSPFWKRSLANARAFVEDV